MLQKEACLKRKVDEHRQKLRDNDMKEVSQILFIWLDQIHGPHHKS